MFAFLSDDLTCEGHTFGRQAVDADLDLLDPDGDMVEVLVSEFLDPPEPIA